ncbi:hypothetical protein HDU98_002347 [Podochytrium sp. JEL0797]|nr:hypothetical protein HDU98_002347 [Podochytrium sp. JEL0797]
MELNSALEYVEIQRSMMNPSSSSSLNINTSNTMVTSDSESIHSAGSHRSAGHHHATIAKPEGSSGWDTDDEAAMQGMTEEEREKHLKFEKMRKMHYNMKTSLAEARRQMELEDEEEENGGAGAKDAAVDCKMEDIKIEDDEEEEDSDF